ncbi:sigma-70 family RNA polymerase sigma factor [bacterium]|nr:sigma-70 family RNA polymerase sigma factor [bacterium]
MSNSEPTQNVKQLKELLRHGEPALSDSFIAACEENAQADWQKIRQGIRQLPENDDSLGSLEFLNLVTWEMLEELPAACRPLWQTIWTDYSELMQGTDLKMLKGMAENANDDWAKFIDRYSPLWAAYFWSKFPSGYVGDQSIDDLVQTCIIVMFKKIARFQRSRIGSTRNYMRQIAANVGRRAIRTAANREKYHSTEVELKTLYDNNSEESQKWEREHKKFVVDFAMNQVEQTCSERDWQVFRAFHVAEMPHKEIAEKFEIEEALSRTICMRTRAKIKAVLKGLNEL